ncbi:unnamed protein product [Triticum turgidum subsp. durum]|uniref:Uncharacterized protein n=1 Tax=Triticum turgidum subsp. durum TaxID=4567 RepID=A0A9R1C6M7_TRITD|nr:unnamed protein product [Triticum turgidum subsp. durum]
MADLLFGLAKTVVEGALTKAKAAIEEEATLRDSARRNLVFITLEFEMMLSFFQVANEERVKNNLVKTWVGQVRDLAYDLEDCVEFIVHLDNKSTWYLRLLPSWIAPPLPLDLAIAEIEELRARAEELSKCYLRYSHIMDSDPKLVTMQQQSSSAAAGAVALSVLTKARERQPCSQDLSQLITRKDDQELQVVSVWETVDSDLGTTSIIRKVYNDASFVPYFTCRAWVKLQHPFNPHNFIQSLMTQFYANLSCKGEQERKTIGLHVLTKMQATGEDLFEEFDQLITDKRYLIVLEGFSNMLEWDAIRTFLPDMKNGSCIIVSTQRFEIASLSIGHSYKLMELKQFSAEHSVCALFKKTRDSRGSKTICEFGQCSSSGNISSKKEIPEWMEKYPLLGRVSEMNILRRYTARACFFRIKVISVWGIAGIGKSALVRHLYHDRILDDRSQFQKYAWVDVSHPFNINDFCRDLLSDFHSERNPIEECLQLLSNYRCLLVIDDLQSMEEWNMIRTALLPEPSRSVIIVVTTDANIATYCASTKLVFNVKALEADAAFNLFKMQVCFLTHVLTDLI